MALHVTLDEAQTIILALEARAERMHMRADEGPSNAEALRNGACDAQEMASKIEAERVR